MVPALLPILLVPLHTSLHPSIILAYIDERLKQLYPDVLPGQIGDFVDWWVLVVKLVERVCLAGILDEPLDTPGRQRQC